tara:strand:- start:128 stop:256 length:129 start_codon:yes stop_codon:yes gene_type:complete
MKYVVNSFRQIQKYEEIQDMASMCALIFLFGFAVIATTGRIF